MGVYEILNLILTSSVIASIITNVISLVKSKRDSKRQKENNTQEDIQLLKIALQADLRHNLLESGEKYIKNGYCSNDQKFDYDNMYKIYHRLGVNGVMDDIHEKVMDLPFVKPKKK